VLRISAPYRFGMDLNSDDQPEFWASGMKIGSDSPTPAPILQVVCAWVPGSSEGYTT
jgi:hypothetical protein